MQRSWRAPTRERRRANSAPSEQIERIAQIVIEAIGERLGTERGVTLEVEPELVARLAREGFDEAFGARPLQRHVRRTLEKEITRAILAGELSDGQRVRAGDGEDGAIALRVVKHPQLALAA